MKKDIENIEIEYIGRPLNVYRTSNTKQKDKEFGNPKLLYEKTKGRMLLWNLTGNRESEDSLSTLLYLNGELGYFAAVSKEEFMKDVPSYGFQDCLRHERIDVEKSIINNEEIELISLSKKALEHLIEIPSK